MKKILTMGLLLSAFNFSFSNEISKIAYVEANDYNVGLVKCFRYDDTQKPVFNTAVIFAANINNTDGAEGDDPNKASLYLNDNVSQTLESSAIKDLHNQGISVLLAILGNHQRAGWSCMDDQDGIDTFTNQVAAVIKKYDLDGIAIDDEYSSCSYTDWKFPFVHSGIKKYSMIRILDSLTNNTDFVNKLVQMVISTSEPFLEVYDNGNEKIKLADLLDQVDDMNYSRDISLRKGIYKQYKLDSSKFGLGFSVPINTPESVNNGALSMITGGYGNIMVFDLDNSQKSIDFVSSIANAEGRQLDVSFAKECLAN